MTAFENTDKSIQELWDDYLFLTKEMAKFLEEEDMELFYELVEQRERLQSIIESAREDGFSSSPSGEPVIHSIQRINQNITLKLQYNVNNSRNQHTISQAYDNLGTAFVGNRMDRQS